jgi:hypothetical protein
LIANFLIKDSEGQALKRATHQPLCCFRYGDNILVIWTQGQEKLYDFLINLINIHNNIQFTKETERDGNIPFPHTDVYRRSDSSLGHTVYRKPTHRNLYLNITFRHQPANKHAALSTLVDRTKVICDSNGLP